MTKETERKMTIKGKRDENRKINKGERGEESVEVYKARQIGLTVWTFIL